MVKVGGKVLDGKDLSSIKVGPGNLDRGDILPGKGQGCLTDPLVQEGGGEHIPLIDVVENLPLVFRPFPVEVEGQGNFIVFLAVHLLIVGAEGIRVSVAAPVVPVAGGIMVRPDLAVYTTIELNLIPVADIVGGLEIGNGHLGNAVHGLGRQNGGNVLLGIGFVIGDGLFQDRVIVGGGGRLDIGGPVDHHPQGDIRRRAAVGLVGANGGIRPIFGLVEVVGPDGQGGIVVVVFGFDADFRADHRDIAVHGHIDVPLVAAADGIPQRGGIPHGNGFIPVIPVIPGMLGRTGFIQGDGLLAVGIDIYPSAGHRGSVKVVRLDAEVDGLIGIVERFRVRNVQNIAGLGILRDFEIVVAVGFAGFILNRKFVISLLQGGKGQLPGKGIVVPDLDGNTGNSPVIIGEDGGLHRGRGSAGGTPGGHNAPEMDGIRRLVDFPVSVEGQIILLGQGNLRFSPQIFYIVVNGCAVPSDGDRGAGQLPGGNPGDAAGVGFAAGRGQLALDILEGNLHILQGLARFGVVDPDQGIAAGEFQVDGETAYLEILLDLYLLFGVFNHHHIEAGLQPAGDDGVILGAVGDGSQLLGFLVHPLEG